MWRKNDIEAYDKSYCILNVRVERKVKLPSYGDGEDIFNIKYFLHENIVFSWIYTVSFIVGSCVWFVITKFLCFKTCVLTQVHLKSWDVFIARLHCELICKSKVLCNILEIWSKMSERKVKEDIFEFFEAFIGEHTWVLSTEKSEGRILLKS